MQSSPYTTGVVLAISKEKEKTSQATLVYVRQDEDYGAGVGVFNNEEDNTNGKTTTTVSATNIKGNGSLEDISAAPGTYSIFLRLLRMIVSFSFNGCPF